ncbi:MAG: DUF1573 domain-containing protein [Rhodanobacteraceae bacterium]
MKNLFLVGSVMLMLAVSARANLVWENPLVELHPAVSAETAVAHFKYKNTGDKPVKITVVRPSCGCTTAQPPADPIAPGASGEIAATFHIGDRSGPQSKTVRVLTDAPNDQGVVLTLHADVPKVLEVKPSFLFWPRTEALGPKTIEVDLGGDFPVNKIDVTPTDPDVKTSVKSLPGKKAFEITVTPPAGNRPINASLKIDPHFPKEKPKIYSAYVRIDAHPQAAAAAASATPK